MAAKVSEDKRKCYFCNSVEDELRIIGSFVVELKEVEHQGNLVLACQSCSRKTKAYNEHLRKGDHLKKKFDWFGFKK